ncbi:MAG TPA: CHASE3 domain-containing protein, partial [Isosphaeraceae bacterium]|nr:CHASE3 domain-containing protein [Isosphaeraceae bacterium]
MTTTFTAIKSWFTGEDIVRALIAAIAVGPIALVVVGAIAITNIETLIDAEGAVEHQIEIRSSIMTLTAGILGAESAQRGYLLVGETSYLEPFDSAAAIANKNADDFVRLTVNDPNLQARATEVRSLVGDKLAELQQTIALRQTRGVNAALAVVRSNRGQIIMDRLRAQTSST